MKAVWNNTVIAESDDTHLVEGTYYFPPDDVSSEYLRPSRARSLCWWKGIARYHHLEVGGETNKGAAWSYPRPYPWIRKIKHHVAFWRGVEIVP